MLLVVITAEAVTLVHCPVLRLNASPVRPRIDLCAASIQAPEVDSLNSLNDKSRTNRAVSAGVK